MPEFNKEAEIEISTREFLEECGNSEKCDILDELITDAITDKHLKISLIDSLETCFPGIFEAPVELSYDQEEFEKSLNKLRKRYYNLSNEEISAINDLAKRF